jgi:GNAT superfamily N-acetyltransferase
MSHLRDARPDEAETLARLQERASVAALAHVFPPERYPYPRDAVLERWAAVLADPDAHVVVAENGDVVGVSCVRRDWLDGLYVVPERWATGVGTALHDRALEIVAKRGLAMCHLWVLEANNQARRFYERRGWRENGTTRVVPYPPNPIDVGYTRELA